MYVYDTMDNLICITISTVSVLIIYSLAGGGYE